jgi:WD40 repeat protein
MSLKGFLRWQDFLDSNRWTPVAPRVPYDFSFSLAFSPDGKTLVSRTNDGIEVWEMKSQKLLRYLDAPGGWHSTVAFTADGKLLISAGNRRYKSTDISHQGEIRIWDAHSGQLLQVLWAHPARAISAIPSPDGAMLVSSGKEQTLRLWKMSTRHTQIERSWPPNYYTNIGSNDYQVRVSPNGRVLATGDFHRGDTSSVGLMDVGSGKPLKGPYGRGPFAFSPDGASIATCGNIVPEGIHSEMNPQILDVLTGEIKSRLLGHPMNMSEMVFSPDGRYLICVGGQDNDQGAVTRGELVVWDLVTRTLKYVRKSHDNYLITVAISPDGKVIATGGQYDHVRLWDTQTGRLMKVLSTVGDKFAQTRDAIVR